MAEAGRGRRGARPRERTHRIGVVQDMSGRKREQARMQLQYATTGTLRESSSLEEAAPRLLAAFGDTLGCQLAALWRPEPAGDRLTCVDAWQPELEAPAGFGRMLGQTRPADRGTVGQALRASRLFSDATTVAFPVVHRGDVLAVFELLGNVTAIFASRTLLEGIGEQLGQFVVRTRAEHALRESEARHRAILDAAIDAIVTIDGNGVIVEFNPAAERTFGFHRRDAVGVPLAHLIIPARYATLREGFGRLVLEGQHRVTGKLLKMSAVRANGTEFPAEMSFTPIHTSDPPLFTGHIRDITTRERAERALRESEERLRSVVNAPPDPVQMKDEKGRWLVANQAILRLFGLDETAFKGKTDAELSATLEEPARTALLECGRTDDEAWRTGESLRCEEVIESKDHPPRVYDVVKIPLFDEDGAPRELVIFARDITAIKAAEAERVTLYEEALQARDEFLSVASHELRTPASSLILAVQALTQMMGRGALREASEENLTRLLGTCERQSRQLKALIDRLLDVGRIRVSGLSLEREPVDLSQLVKETIQGMDADLKRAGCEVRIRAPECLCGHWDRSRLVEVISNLLSNAAKYAAGAPIDVFIGNHGDHVCLAVRDHGIGISSDRQTEIFEKFGRAVSKGKYAGLGLGLFIVREIVEAHGGHVDLTSEPNVGSTFIVELPIDPIDGLDAQCFE